MNFGLTPGSWCEKSCMACKEEAHSVACCQCRDGALGPQKAEAAMLGVLSMFLYSRKKKATERMKRL